jgi:outer membrane protein
MKTISKWLLAGALVASFNLHGQERKLSLEQALTLANENNKALKAELMEAKSFHEETKISKAAMLPTLSAGGSYSYYIDKQVIFMPGSFTGNETEPVVDVAVGGKNVLNSYVSLHQPIVSETSRRQIKAARLNESIKALDLKDTRANLHVEVTATYYRALLIKESIILNRQSLDRNLRSLADSKLLLLQGKSLKVDTLRNFIAVENLKTTISHLENQYKVIELQLNRLMGINTNESIEFTDSLKHDFEAQYFAAVEALHADAIQNRPDIQSQKLNVELSRNMVSQSRAQRLPTLSLIGAYQAQAQADDRQLNSYRWPKTSFIGLQANVPIFSGNKINSRVRQSNFRLQREELLLQDATQNASTEIITFQNDLKELLQRLSVQAKTVNAAETNYNIINDRYQNGLSSRLELSDAELALTEAKMGYLNTVYNTKITKLQLDKALGLL